MNVFGGRHPEEVRETLLENGVLCGHRDGKGEGDCTVIIQANGEGDLSKGVSAHWDTVHGKGK